MSRGEIKTDHWAFGEDTRPSQRLGKIKPGAACDKVLLVLLNNATLEPVTMWEAPYAAVVARLAEPGSKARNERGAMSVHDFKKLPSQFGRSQN
jgi:hypothetical protein